MFHGEVIYSKALRKVDFEVVRVLQHPDMIVAEVSLPESLLCAKANPHTV